METMESIRMLSKTYLDEETRGKNQLLSFGMKVRRSCRHIDDLVEQERIASPEKKTQRLIPMNAASLSFSGHQKFRATT